jgi:hypothetical protein
MIKRMKNIIYVMCVVMAFTAQTNRPDDKGQHHAAGARPGPVVRPGPIARPIPLSRPAPVVRPAPVAHNTQTMRRDQTQERQGPRVYAVPATNNQLFHQQAAYRQPAVRPFVSQPSYQDRGEPRFNNVPSSIPVENNQLFGRQHHNNWQPRYNFYENEYHFYPYVNIASTVELSANCVSIGFNGQTYYYDRGTFYQQDEQGQYVAVAPIIGLVVNALPVHARQIIVNDQVFYRYKGIFYVQIAQGYQVVGPVQPVPVEE